MTFGQILRPIGTPLFGQKIIEWAKNAEIQ